MSLARAVEDGRAAEPTELTFAAILGRYHGHDLTGICIQPSLQLESLLRSLAIENKIKDGAETMLGVSTALLRDRLGYKPLRRLHR